MSAPPQRILLRDGLSLSVADLHFSAIRSSGPGGQNVNKVATAIQLHFDIASSALPASVKQRLLSSGDSRINSQGVLVLKSQRSRSQLENRELVCERLRALICAAQIPEAPRIATRTPPSQRRKRLDSKKKRGDLKGLRRRPAKDE